MSLEADIFTAIKSLVSNRVYPDLAPANAVKPYVTYQAVGGSAVNFMDSTVPSQKNARVQVNVWGDTRASVSTLARQIEDALRATVALKATVLGAPVASYEPETGLRGSRQDFSFWHSS